MFSKRIYTRSFLLVGNGSAKPTTCTTSFGRPGAPAKELENPVSFVWWASECEVTEVSEFLKLSMYSFSSFFLLVQFSTFFMEYFSRRDPYRPVSQQQIMFRSRSDNRNPNPEHQNIDQITSSEYFPSFFKITQALRRDKVQIRSFSWILGKIMAS